MQTSQSYSLGVYGEDLACEFLISKGYVIVERRYRVYGIEIDIIAQDRDFVVMVEVKTRSTDFFAAPSSSVNIKKQQRIIRAANIYAQNKNIDKEIRFDIISIIKNEDQQYIEHINDAFSPFV